jgi:heme oxygenase
LREENSRIFYLQPFSKEECIEFMRKSLGSKVDEKYLTKLLDSSNFILKDFIRPIVLNKLLELIKSKTRFKTLYRLITDRENFESIILQINNNLV